MNISVISIGNPDKHYEQIIEKYIKKCNKYYKVSHIPIRSVKIKDDKTRVKKEFDLITNTLKSRQNNKGFICALDEKGKSLDTKGFAGFIKKRILSSVDLFFIIGGAAGLPEEIKRNSDLSLRLSDFTLQHDIALTVLFEQIYRAFTILKNVPYHK